MSLKCARGTLTLTLCARQSQRTNSAVAQRIAAFIAYEKKHGVTIRKVHARFQKPWLKDPEMYVAAANFIPPFLPIATRLRPQKDIQSGPTSQPSKGSRRPDGLRHVGTSVRKSLYRIHVRYAFFPEILTIA